MKKFGIGFFLLVLVFWVFFAFVPEFREGISSFIVFFTLMVS